MRTETPRVVIVAGDAPLLAARTERALARYALRVDACELEPELARALQRDEPVWLLRAGAWPLGAPELEPSATGRPLVAFGSILDDPAWDELVRGSSGVFDGGEGPSGPFVASVFVERPSALRERLLAGEGLDAAAWSLARDGTHRALRWHAIDVGYDPGLRVCLAVTTLHRGGAERLVLDLAKALRARGTAVLLAVLDRPQRETYPVPDGTLLVYEYEKSRARRIDALADAAAHFGADVIHAHLLDGDELRALAGHGARVVCTLHNDRPGWPARLASLRPGELAATLTCSWRVRDAATELGAPVRVASNGVDRARVASRAERRTARTRLELPPDATVVLVVANPRRQKRLELAARAVAELRRDGDDAWLVLAGAPLASSEDALEAQALFDLTVREHGLERFVRQVGSRADVASLYAAADVLLTTSDYEGLSVAQLEAIAAGLPVVTRDVSGTRELARSHRGVSVVPFDATPSALARAIRQAARGPRPELASAFEIGTTAARHQRLYRACAGASTRRRSLLLVTNNFSTGGAQASARRLLLTLRERGVEVAAAVLEEQARFPSTWRRQLEASGVPVLAAPRAGSCDPAVTARAVSDLADRRGDGTIVFWNVIPEHKLLVADAAVGRRVFDVSPGEMYFASLDRYFQKPRADLPYFDARDYGSLLDGVVVKYAAEAARAESVLGAPVTVIPNGVPLGTTGPRRRDRERVVFGTLARLSPDKRLDQLVEALRHAGDGCELWVGGAVERGTEDHERELRERAAGLPVRWCGEVDSASFLAELDAFVMVSEPAGCPNALLEAMAAGLPLAATDAGGASEQIEDGRTGLLVPRGDARALGQAMRRLAQDADLAATLAAHARQRAAERFSLDRMADAYERLLLP